MLPRTIRIQRSSTRKRTPTKKVREMETPTDYPTFLNTLNDLRDNLSKILSELNRSSNKITSQTFSDIISAYNLPNVAISTNMKKLLQIHVHLFDRDKKRNEKYFKDVLEKFKTILQSIYPSGSTLAGYYSDCIKVFKKHYGIRRVDFNTDKEMNYVFKYLNDKELTKSNDKLASEKRAVNQNSRGDRTAFPMSIFKNYVEKNIYSKNANARYISVMIASGFRFIDILKTGAYKPVDGKPDFIHITSAAKLKKPNEEDIDGKKTEQLNIKKKLLFISYDQFDEGIKFIRNYYKTKLETKKTNRDLTNSTIQNVNRLLKKEFNLEGTKITSHILRHFHGLTHHALYSNGSNEAYYLKEKVFGHTSSETSISYAKYTVFNDLVQPKTKDVAAPVDSAIIKQVSLNTNNINDIKNDIKEIVPLKNDELRNAHHLTNTQRLENIQQLKSKGIRTTRALKTYNYGSRVITLSNQPVKKSN